MSKTPRRKNSISKTHYKKDGYLKGNRIEH